MIDIEHASAAPLLGRWLRCYEQRTRPPGAGLRRGRGGGTLGVWSRNLGLVWLQVGRGAVAIGCENGPVVAGGRDCRVDRERIIYKSDLFYPTSTDYRPSLAIMYLLQL